VETFLPEPRALSRSEELLRDAYAGRFEKSQG